jgi:D-alanyl-lipoteichoic acid acyltransferase DltB (MBOAT superfamily)
MLFNSLQFLVFFAIVTAAYFALPHQWRWKLLLVASCYFYMAFVPSYILILFGLILLDYFAAIAIERTGGERRRWLLRLSLLANIGVLGVFKYYNFIDQNLATFFHSMGWHYASADLGILLPIGLSFHTFQSMSYTIEVYRRHQKAERHLGIYALYVLFYPQMVAGPIERPQNLLHQFREEKHFEYGRVADGLKLMAWGLFKKVVIADRLAVVVNQVYNNPGQYRGLYVILATYFFAIQIYCDFSGYSDIAIGAAQVMGIKLMTNFNRPYYSKSIAEFWKRWHISLSTWFRDYLYISLGGNRVARWRWYFNLIVVFLVSGLWHGANWVFVVWGGLHGLYLVGSIVTHDLRAKLRDLFGLENHPRLHRGIQLLVTFHLVLLGWVFFRAESLRAAGVIIRSMFDFSTYSARHLPFWVIDRQELAIAVVAIVTMEVIHLIQRGSGVRQALSQRPAWQRWALYAGCILFIMMFGKFESQDFIYFQF